MAVMRYSDDGRDRNLYGIFSYDVMDRYCWSVGLPFLVVFIYFVVFIF